MNQNEKIKQAQAGDNTQSLSLLFDFGWRKSGRWKGFLGKYEQLLWHGRVDFRNKDTRRFLQLYMKDPILRRKLTWRYQDYASTLSAQEVANYLQNKTRESFERAELRQELSYLFLDCLERYVEKPKVDFAGFINNYFRYRVYHLLKNTMFSNDLFNQREYVQYQEEDAYEYELPAEEYATEEQLGVLWVNGACTPVFSSLTGFERMIIRDHYLLKRNDSEVGKTYGYHRNTILNKRHKAIKKIKESLG